MRHIIRQRARRRPAGFTLIELLVVVAVVALLATIAYPSYRDHIRKSSRVAAQQELLELSAMQEKIYLNSNAFTSKLTNAYDGTTSGGLGKTGGKSTDGRYTLALTATAQSYTLSATPVAGTQQDGDGAFQLASTGTRTCPDPAPTWCKNGIW
ncbi:MAG TPA: type IV pilin protein [Burkholderiales bacterium]|nr:type IV pilin protein [Burkholderiales bacterium]